MYLAWRKGINTSLHSKNLTWRDMQHLVVRTSNPAHLATNDWKTNGVGRRGKSPSRCFSLLPPLSFRSGLSFHFPATWTLCDQIDNIIIGCTSLQIASDLLKISTSLIHLFTYNVSLFTTFLNWFYSYFQQYWFFSLSPTVSHSYGYGLLDAGAIVALAKNWTNVGPQRKCVISLVSEPR